MFHGGASRSLFLKTHTRTRYIRVSHIKARREIVSNRKTVGNKTNIYLAVIYRNLPTSSACARAATLH